MFNLHMLKRLYLMLFLLCGTYAVNAQTFGASIIAGLNATQINGDELHGYHNPGLVLGLRSNIFLSEKMDLDIELLFDQRGSQQQFFGGDQIQLQRSISLGYLSIPVLISYYDWLSNDDEYYKMRFSGGFSVGRLFSESYNDDLFIYQEYEGLLNTTDFSFVAGATFKWNPKMGVHLRYSQSLNKLYTTPEDPAINLNELRSFLWSLRFEYSIL